MFTLLRYLLYMHQNNVSDHPMKTASVIILKLRIYYIDSNTNYAKTICKTTTKRMEGNILLSFILTTNKQC